MTTPRSRQKTPRLKAGAERLGAGFLGGKALGVGGGALGPAVGFAALDLGEDPLGEALAVALERLLDPPDVDHVVAEADDHLSPRLPGFTAGKAASSGGRASAAIGRDLDAGQGDKRNAEIGLAARTIDQAGRTHRLAALLVMPAMHSRDDRPVVTMSSTIRTRAPLSIVKPRRRASLPSTRSKKIGVDAQLPRHLIADDDAAHGRRGDKIDPFADLALSPSGKGRAQACGARRIHQDAARIADSAGCAGPRTG